MKKASALTRGRLLLCLAASVAVLLLFLPVVVLIGQAFSSGLTLGTELQSSILAALWLSLQTSFISVLLICAFGTPLAYILARWRFVGRRALNILVELPIVLPPAVAGLALLLTFGRRGFLGQPLDEFFGIRLPFTTMAVILAQCFVSAPFYIRAAQLAFSNVQRDIEDAARVDGASDSHIFFRIILPLSFRFLSSGLILAWARALGEFGATIFFAGSIQGRSQTMPLLVYAIFERDLNAAIWTSVILIFLALFALILSQALVKSPKI